MLKSCKYCGHIHDDRLICEAKKKAEARRFANRKETEALRFRRSNAWTEKSVHIRARDHYICVCCKALMCGTVDQYNTRDLSVHHIVPIQEDYSKRLDDDNLITVCAVHHELCEAGKITRDQQKDLAIRSISGDEKELGDFVI